MKRKKYDENKIALHAVTVTLTASQSRRKEPADKTKKQSCSAEKRAPCPDDHCRRVSRKWRPRPIPGQKNRRFMLETMGLPLTHTQIAIRHSNVRCKSAYFWAFLRPLRLGAKKINLRNTQIQQNRPWAHQQPLGTHLLSLHNRRVARSSAWLAV